MMYRGGVIPASCVVPESHHQNIVMHTEIATGPMTFATDMSP